MDLDFPLCREARHEVPVRAVIARAVTLLRERLGHRLVGVLLTGSFSRGEGSVLPAGGRLRVLGDIEFLVVLAGAADYRRLRPRLAEWEREASLTLGGDRLRVELEFGSVEADWLGPRARPSIFVYDLVTHAKVVWGPADLLKTIPAFGTDRIPREDALHLLFNRTVEQLEAWDRLADVRGAALLDIAYQEIKLRLDLAGSALAFEGVHVTSYDERPAAFARLAGRTPALAARLPAGFQAELERAARAKLAPTLAAVLPACGSDAEQRRALRRRLLGLAPALTALLGWELEVLLGARGPLPEQLPRFLASQPRRRRAREWAKVALHPLPPPLPLGRLRAARLFWRSTPRALLYAAGALAYLHLGSGTPAPGLAALLPLPRRLTPRTGAEQRRAVVALWRWCIRNN